MNGNSFLRQTRLVLGIALLSVTATPSLAFAHKAPEPGDGTTQATPLGRDSTRMLHAIRFLADLLAQTNHGGTKRLLLECDVSSATFSSRNPDANVQFLVDLFNALSAAPRAELCKYGVADINASFAASADVLANSNYVFQGSATLDTTAGGGAWTSDPDGDVLQASMQKLRWRYVGPEWKRASRPILNSFERFSTALNLGADADENIVVHVDATVRVEQGGRDGYASLRFDPPVFGIYPPGLGTSNGYFPPWVGEPPFDPDRPSFVSESTCYAAFYLGSPCVTAAFTSTLSDYVRLFDANKTTPAGLCTVKINGVTKAWVAKDGSGNFLWPMKFQTSAICSSSNTRCKAACPIAGDATSCVQSVNSTMPAGMTITCPFVGGW